MFIELLLFLVISFFTLIFVKILQIDRSYYKRRGLKYKIESFELTNVVSMFIKPSSAEEFSKRIYNAFPDEPLYGILDFGKPVYIVRSPEVAKKIGIKDFDYFEDHRPFIDEKTDKLWGNSLLLMRGQKWRQMRATLSPAFTGSKMRQMYELVSDCVTDVIKHLKDQSDAGKKLNIEMKDLFTRYTNDVISSCAFGFKVNSLAEPNNEFYLKNRERSTFTGFKVLMKMLTIMMVPRLARALKIEAADSANFKAMILSAMDYRKKNGIFRPDMINIMMQVRDGSLKYQAEEKSNKESFATVEESDVGKANINRIWNDDEIVAQCFLFLVAGFETTSTALTFAAYELLANPDIQQKLYEEIVEMNKRLDGKRINYDLLQKMEYMDQVVSEVLRKWPAAATLDRNCVKNYVFDDGERKFDIDEGSVFFIPSYGIHHDPKYYSDPEKFNPDRFSDENIKDIQPGTYLPFGIGPRNCIGSRFALMEIKAILYHLLLNFSFEMNEKTEIPVKLKKVPMVLATKNGVHLQLKPRSS